MARLVDLEIVTKAGKFDADPLLKDVKDAAIYCRRFELNTLSPTDPRTGTPTGSRQYTGITIEKRLDAASPGIFQLFVGNTGFEAHFRIHKANTSTSEDPGELALTVSIGGEEKLAWISSYKLIVPDVETLNKDDPGEPYELITFSFSKIKFHKSGTGHDGKPREIVVTDTLLGVR